MAQAVSLDFQIHLDFFFAYDTTALIQRVYGLQGLPPLERPSRNKLDHAALEHLALILSGYDFAAETWAAGVRRQEVTVALRNPDLRRSCWTVRHGTGNPGVELYGFLYETETPFETADDAHTCCVQLVSPAFTDTDEQWTAFTSSSKRLLKRLQTPSALHPPATPEQPPNKHLAWANKTCSFTVTVQPVDDRAHISWPTLQNLYCAWGTCSHQIEHLQNPRHSPSTNSSFRKLAPPGQQTTAQCLERLYAIPDLAAYFNLESQIASQDEIAGGISLLTEGTDEDCSGIRFEEHRATLDVAQIQFWTRLTFQAAVSCQEMAAAGRRFGGTTRSPGFMQFSDELIKDRWVRERAWDMGTP
ncbi:MAG: hypothetical protein LQ346_005886 [Caloplaca aetnensis]|nr:MAG: hypothetical protein LQ346_005886 [Caloplaca aetnensis]